MLVAALSVASTLSCSDRAPSAPSPPAPEARGKFLGTWRGTIASAVIGSGTATIVFDSQIGSDDFPLLSGTSDLRFLDSAFSWNGRVSAGLDTTRTRLVIFFDRSTVPCPLEPGGTAQRVMFSMMAFTATTMRGNYVVAGCPGGTLELALVPK